MKARVEEPSGPQLLRRRSPRQKRSQIVYDKIIATAKTLFREEGYAYVSTNRIAERANISIGSIYQYFANCESIALSVYENACSKAALSMNQRTIDSLGCPIDVAIAKNIAAAFDVYEKDRYALLQLINEVPELRRVSQPISVGGLTYHTSRIFFEQHFPDVDRAVIAGKSYILDKCVTGAISRYLDERPAFLSKAQAIAEVTELVMRYVETLNLHRRPARTSVP